MGVQQKVETALQNLFEWWARVLIKHRCLITVISGFLLVGLSAGFSQKQEYENSTNLWSPQGNRSELAQLRARELFPSNSRFMSIIIKAKGSSNLMTYEALKEMRNIGVIIQDHMAAEQVNTILCRQPTCLPISGGLSYFSDLATLDGVSNDAEWLAKVKTGVTPSLQPIRFSQVWKDTTPPVAFDSSNVVSSSLTSAKVTTISYIFNDLISTNQEDIKKNQEKIKKIELDIEKKILDGPYTQIEVNMFTVSGNSAAFSEDVQKDLALIGLSVVLVAIYVVIFLGNFSPIHNRFKLGALGFMTVILTYTSSYGLLSLCGLKVSGIHNLLPFLLIGVGADDMFVVVNSVDQVDTNLPSNERFVKGFKHAGPSITITSFTNIMAFFISASTSLLALKSFCIYAGLGIMFLYMATCSFFSCIFLFDLERQHKQQTDCCGLCFCSEDNALCCRGSCLTLKQKSYPFRGTADQAITIKEQGFSTFVQKVLHDYFSWFLMKTWVRVSVLIIYVIYIGVSAYGLTILDVDFKQSYFINSKSQIAAYNSINTQYFQEGQTNSLYLDNQEVDVTTSAYQQSVKSLFQEIDDSTWTSGSVNSWYNQLVFYSKKYNADTGTYLDCKDSYDSTNNIVVSNKFYACLNIMFSNGMRGYVSNVLKKTAGSPLSSSNPIMASKQSFVIKPIQSSSVEGTAYLREINKIEDRGPANTRSFSRLYFSYETYFVFSKETAVSIGSSLVVVTLVLLMTTGSLSMSLFVLLCVGLVVFFLFALLPFWDLTLNSVTIINVVIALGLSVDYSAHIGHSYQSCKLTGTPSQNKSEIRIQKVRMALTQMGSSVFHGAASTFLAILPLSLASSYIFTVFFRMWFGIIVFGVANGFILLPVLLSFIGPLKENEYASVSQEEHPENIEMEKNVLNIQDINQDVKLQPQDVKIQPIVYES